MRRTEYLSELTQDVRFACRQLLKNPGFSVVAIVTLALGIGATSAIFSAVHAVVLKPLPVPDPHRHRGGLRALSQQPRQHVGRQLRRRRRPPPASAHDRHPVLELQSGRQRRHRTDHRRPDDGGILRRVREPPALGRVYPWTRISPDASRSSCSAIGCGRADSARIDRSSAGKSA